jgi:hypothetical protein
VTPEAPVGPAAETRHGTPTARSARLVLVDHSGGVLGALPAIPVATPWWQDVAPVVGEARERFGIDVVILRLLEAERSTSPGGLVTYLAEVDRPPAARLRAWTHALDPHPLRMPWAVPGGPRADLSWADATLADRGLERAGPPEQVRTWNLSSLWRLPLTDGAAWLKHVPPFFGHEGALLELLRAYPVPPLLGHDGARILMPELRGKDQYDAIGSVMTRMIEILVSLQTAWSGRSEELLALGLPDWRPQALLAAIGDVVDRSGTDLSRAQRSRLETFVEALPDRFMQIAEAGLPDTLVHGDFHGGNARGDEGGVVLLDWGDSGVGHPLLDQPAFFAGLAPERAAPLGEHWIALWKAAVPGSDPDRAAALLAPIAAARQAVIYRGFLDRIEPSEQPYHRRDPAVWLRAAAGLLGRQESRLAAPPRAALPRGRAPSHR